MPAPNPVSKRADPKPMTKTPKTVPAAPPATAPQLPEELALEVRRLTHDLSNALEIIVQTSYLLGLAELKEPAAEWLRMLDSGVARSLEINKQLREYIKSNSPR
jgi:hypothetical protein